MEQVTQLSLYRPRPVELAAFLPYACGQLEAPFAVTILQTIEEPEVKAKKGSKEKGTPLTAPSTSQYSGDKRESAAVMLNYGEEGEVVMRFMCDAAGRPYHIIFYHCTDVPRLLMKIIGLCVPYHPQLTMITIRWGPLDGFVLYEIAKFLPLSQITDICLDDSPVAQHNYYLLLEQQTHLRSLSLARCELVDADAGELAARLAHATPAARTLAVLALDSNMLTDEGARVLGDMLRTNRTLRHLNLAGNRITDTGAKYILSSLERFPVSSAEMLVKRRRTFEYLKAKREIYERCVKELAEMPEPAPAAGRARGAQARARRGSLLPLAAKTSTAAADTLAVRAEAMVMERLGPYKDPFEASEMVLEEGQWYCTGNLTLCSLNLAYNEVGNMSVSRLAQVLHYQAEVAARRRAGGGLLRVALDGNQLEATAAAAAAAALLEARVAERTSPPPTLHIKSARKGKPKSS